MAAVMEFLHTATLVHDDIIDNAETRRNRPSINSRFGNQTAVLMGDWLYMSAFETSLAERSLPILDILTTVTRKMTEGELLQLTLLGRTNISEEQYFDILRRKTAYLFSACCEIGSILGGAEPEKQRALREYGMNLGTAFQLVDDLLDFTASDEVLGKAAGVDLLEGKLTLPLIFLLEKEAAMRRAVQTVMPGRELQGGGARHTAARGRAKQARLSARASAPTNTRKPREARSTGSPLGIWRRSALHPDLYHRAGQMSSKQSSAFSDQQSAHGHSLSVISDLRFQIAES